MPLWLHWIILGLIAGSLSKYLMPGRDPAGCLITIALGIIGSLLGGWIGSHLGWGDVGATGFSIRSIALATLGAIMLLLIGRLVVHFRRRA
jgi:uncharacterized membrane protein YeaQ/YmgE (transglycosylase-associated protein family)